MGILQLGLVPSEEVQDPFSRAEGVCRLLPPSIALFCGAGMEGQGISAGRLHSQGRSGVAVGLALAPPLAPLVNRIGGAARRTTAYCRNVAIRFIRLSGKGLR
jgi:hypothetical protein